MMTLIERNRIRPIISARFTFDQIAGAHILAEQRTRIGKIVVTLHSI
ncbi:MAG: zinc-binding dehydrogenase [Paramuribaculum sp.]|nr:zinc-binding dehydrogenase [Paramuribaculum sp.]